MLLYAKMEIVNHELQSDLFNGGVARHYFLKPCFTRRRQAAAHELIKYVVAECQKHTHTDTHTHTQDECICEVKLTESPSILSVSCTSTHASVSQQHHHLRVDSADLDYANRSKKIKK